MMRSRSDEIERRLLEMRGRRLRPKLRRWLAEEAHIEVTDEDFLPLDQTRELRTRFIDCLRGSTTERQIWPADEVESVEARLVSLARPVGETRAIWLHNDDGMTGAVCVPVAPMLDDALRLFVTRQSDLMLSADDATDGLCVEWNHMPEGDEYEWCAWGVFAGVE